MQVTRREFLRVGMMATAGLMAGCTPQASATKRSVTMAYDAVDFWMNQGKEFTQATGIDFKYESIPFPQLHDKYLASFLSGGKEYDAVHVRDDWVAEWGPKGWLEPIDDRLTPELRGQHFPKAFDYLSSGGKIYGMPRYIWLHQFYYNTQLFEMAGIKSVPKTWTELREAAKRLSGGNQFGFIMPLGATGSTTRFAECLRAEGQELIVNRKPNFNTDAGVKALGYLVGLIQDVSVDPSSFELPNDTAMLDIFTQGHAAMCVGAPPTLSMAADPLKSKVVGKIQVALMPGGTKAISAGYSELGSVGIPASCADKDAAWEYLKFVTSKEQQKKMALAIGRIPTMPSLLADPEVQKSYPAAAMASEQMKYSMGMSVVVPEQAEVNAALANELVACLLGKKTIQAALGDAEAAVLKTLNVK